MPLPPVPMYTDFGLFTANADMCADVSEVFLHITSLAKANKLKHLWLAPFTMNFDRLRFVAERAELGERREAILAVTIPERPGSFREFCALLGTRSITEFNYRYADPKSAHIFVGIEVADRHGKEHRRRGRRNQAV